MRSMRSFALSAGLLLYVTPASAEFTPAEVQNVIRLRDGVGLNLAAAQAEIALALRDNQDTVTARKNSLIHVSSAIRDLSNAMAYLMDVIPVGTFSRPDPALRAQRVEKVWVYLDRVAAFVELARADLASSPTGTNTARARDIWLLSARNALRLVDRSLSYGNAHPLEFPALIGPHGDYEVTQWEQWRAWTYLMDSVDKVFALYGTPEPLNWHALAQYSQDIYRVWIEGMPLMAGVPKANQVTLSQFWRVLGHTERLTNFRIGGVSEKLLTILATLTTSSSPAAAGAIVRLGDSWRHMDAAVWGVLIFLNCNQVSDPQGCAANQHPVAP